MGEMETSRISSIKMKIEKIHKKIKRKLPKTTTLLEATIIMSCLIIAFIIRMTPLKYGATLSEFDPYWQYKMAKYITDRGWGGFKDFFSWYDTTVWYPFGRSPSQTSFYGLSFLLAFVKLSLETIGINIETMDLAIIFPVILGTFAVLLMYYFGKEIGGKTAGLLAALLLAINTAHIGRTHLGWFDDESLAVPLMIIAFIAYLRANKETSTKISTIVYSIIAGISLGYMTASWGASRFPMMFIPVYALVLVILGRYRRQLLIATTITMSVAIMIATHVPKLGPGYLKEITVLTSIAAIVVLAIIEISKLAKPEKQLAIQIMMIGAIIIAAVVIEAIGIVALPGTKFLSVIMPTLREELPILVSVAEHQMPTWATIYLDYGPALLLIPFGIYYMVTKRKDTDIFLALLTLFSTYFLASMARLTLIAAPVFTLVAAYALSEILKMTARNLQKIMVEGKKRYRGALPSPEYVVLTPLVIISMIIFYVTPYAILPTSYNRVSPLENVQTPTTLLSSSVPIRGTVDAWAKALLWIKDNTPPGAVILSWWDYGYWINVVGNRTTLADNGTLNSTQIGWIAYAFMSREEVAIKVLKRFNVDYVAIFVTHDGQRLLGYGEEGKWIWMLRIANQESKNLGVSKFNESAYVGAGGNIVYASDKFWSETLIGNLNPYKPTTWQGQTYFIYQEPSLKYFKLVFSSDNPHTAVAYVYIYKVIYEGID
ncbi:MAG: STT3 domain-containing protein [Nitrososphaerota archaeon]